MKETKSADATPITCLCLETFPDGDRPYVHLTPPCTLDVEGRTGPSSMVCCNKCWKDMPMFQRAALSLLTTPTKDGGLALGALAHERFWPDLLRTFSDKPSPLPPEPDGDYFEQEEHSPPMSAIPGDEVTSMIDRRNAARAGGKLDG